jgi:hypothetical protein
LAWVQNQEGENHALTWDKSPAPETSGSDRYSSLTELSLDTATLDPAAFEARGAVVTKFGSF